MEMATMVEASEAQMITREALVALREKLALATAQDLDTAQTRTDTVALGEYIDCPYCDGEGSVEGATITNYDDMAIGVQFFGVGDQFVYNEAAYRALWEATPSLLRSADVASDLFDALTNLLGFGINGSMESQQAQDDARAALLRASPSSERKLEGGE